MSKVLLLGTSHDDARILLWCLKEAGHDAIVVGNASRNHELEYSPLCKKFYAVPEALSIQAKSKELLPYIEQVVQRESIDIILPTGFESIKYISLYKSELNEICPSIPVPHLNTIDLLGNKFSFSRFCGEHDIPHPNSHLLENIGELVSGELPIRFPVITKPLAMSGGKGIHRFNNADDLHEYLSHEKADGSNALPILLQEFIPGTDVDFNGFAIDGHLSAWTVQQGVEVKRTNKSDLSWVQFLDNNEVYEIGKAIVEQSGYSGPIHIDMRIDDRNGRVSTIEINPRFWASTFYSLCDGVNFPDVAINSSFNPDYKTDPEFSLKLWGSPHHLPSLILSKDNDFDASLVSKHTLLQVKFEVMNRLYKSIAAIKSKLSGGRRSNFVYLERPAARNPTQHQGGSKAPG